MMFEGLKKRWNEAYQQAKKDYEAAKDNDIIRMPPAVFENGHETTPVNLNPAPCSSPSFGDEPPGTPIDTEITALVAEMNRVGIHTTCSCQGHDGEAYIGIRLGDGTSYKHRKDIFGPGQDELTLRWRRK